MKNKKLFFDAIETLLYSWGGDTPSEATWAANELLDFYEAETNTKLGFRFLETSDDEDDECKRVDKAWEELKASST